MGFNIIIERKERYKGGLRTMNKDIKIRDIIEKKDNQIIYSVVIKIPSEYLPFVYIGNNLKEGPSLVIPRELLIKICQEAEGIYF
jgi:hypothetical protein